MATDQKSSKFGIGLFIGTLLGGLTALFLSPTSGEENRKLLAKKIKELEKMLEEEHIDKKVKEIFGEVTEEARDLYLKTKKELIKRVKRPSRKNFGKIKNLKKLKGLMQKHNLFSTMPYANNITIDNTKLSPKQTARKIKKHFRL